jgi:hypothetical protein
MKSFLLLLAAAASSFSISAQGLILADQRPNWSIGVAAFEGRSLSPENIYLTRSFPLLLRERLEPIPEHYFSEAEVLAHRRRIIQEERQRLVKAVGDDRRALDELFFASDPVQDKGSVYEERITANLDAIRELGELDPEKIDFPRSKPLQFVSGADGQLVFDREVLSPFQLAKQQNLDALLWGRFEEVQGFLYFEITVYNAVLGESVYTYSDAAGAMELYELFDELIEELATVLWGRDWSSLAVQTVPPGASVWIDGRFQGRTPLRIPYLLPGSKQMRIQIPGYQTLTRTIELSPYDEQVQQIDLVPQALETFDLASDPAGAKVYRESEWLGTTPLSVEKPQEPSRLLLRREGFLDFPLYIDPAVEQSITVDLLPENLDPAKVQERRRSELYRAFGAFALSIPFPLIFRGLGYDYYSLGLTSSDPVDFLWYSNLDPQDIANGFWHAYRYSLVISGGLLMNLAVRLIRYLQAADRKA